MKTKIASVIIILIFIGAGYYIMNSQQSKPDAMMEDDTSKEGEMMEEKMMTYTQSAQLADVSGGTASGTAQAGFENGTYGLLAEFQNLPELEEGFFYEGWVVRPEPMDVISTGGLSGEGEMLVNEFTSSEDLTDHVKYVLTLEPDDGDPAPAEHILDGTFE